MAHLKCDGGRRVVVLNPGIIGDAPIARHRSDGTMCNGALSICGVNLDFMLVLDTVRVHRVDGQPESTLRR